MKLVLIGGHLSPLISVIEAMPENIKLMVIGRKYAFEGDKALSLEYQMLQKLKIPFLALTTGRLQRELTSHTLLSLLKLPYGFFQAFSALRSFKPNAVVSFGGYISLPVSFASWFLGIPVVIHEQTLNAGLANRIVAIFAKKVCVAFEESKKYFLFAKTVVTGNFLRREILYPILDKSFYLPKQNLPVIYITGGSSGAHGINLLVEGCLNKLLKNFIVIHQAGDAKEFHDFERLNKLKELLTKEQKERYIIKKFYQANEVSTVLRRANLVVSRAGMNTVTELLYIGVPTLFIPLPFSQKNEQFKNALLFKNTGLGEIEEQEGLTSDRLFEKISTMINNKEIYEKAREKAQSLVKTNVAEEFIRIIQSEAYEHAAQKT